MKTLAIAVASLGLVLTAGSTRAADLVVKDVHLCCGACVKAVNKVLPNATVDREAKTVTVPVEDEAGAKKAIETLTDAGFGGKPTLGDKSLELPASGATKGAKADKVTFKGVHLCCGACVTAVQKAMGDLGDVAVDRGEKTVTITGDDIDVSKAHDTLVEAGFYGKVAK
jgi:periplasmic mercuric ion binding protein